MSDRIKEAAEKYAKEFCADWPKYEIYHAHDLPLFSEKGFEAGANFMLEELSKGVESVVCPKCKSDNLEYPDAQNCETSTRCCACGNCFYYEEERHNLLISANAKIAKLTEALTHARDVIYEQANYHALKKQPNIAMLLHDKCNQITRVLKSCEQYDEQTEEKI